MKTSKYFTYPEPEFDPAKKLTPYEWLTSDCPEAVDWRKAAEMPAWNAVYEMAQKEGNLGTIFIPPTPIERPPTKVGKFFQLPEEPAPTVKGKFFTIPANNEGA